MTLASRCQIFLAFSLNTLIPLSLCQPPRLTTVHWWVLLYYPGSLFSKTITAAANTGSWDGWVVRTWSIEGFDVQTPMMPYLLKLFSRFLTLICCICRIRECNNTGSFAWLAQTILSEIFIRAKPLMVVVFLYHPYKICLLHLDRINKWSVDNAVVLWLLWLLINS